ncbi:hypothetical protein D3C72_1490590 [compost metagenome]
MDTHHGQARQGDEGHVGTDHVHLAVGEVDHANDAVHHRVADGDQGIGAADGQSINQLLEEMVDLRHYSAPKNLICISLAGVGQETAGDGFKIFRWPAPGSRESGP